VRNAIVEHMDTVVAYPWRDPKTNKKISGATVFLVLLAMAKHVWSELGHCTAGNTALAISAGVSADYVPLAKRGAAQMDVIKYVGESKLGTDTYVMGVGMIEAFVERASLPVPEILKEFRRLNPDPKKLAAEDAAEEEQMMEAEDASIPVFDTEGKPVPTAEEIMDEAGLYLTSSEGREFGRQTST
jgi:hypothetical protein